MNQHPSSEVVQPSPLLIPIQRKPWLPRQRPTEQANQQPVQYTTYKPLLSMMKAIENADKFLRVSDAYFQANEDTSGDTQRAQLIEAVQFNKYLVSDTLVKIGGLPVRLAGPTGEELRGRIMDSRYSDYGCWDLIFRNDQPPESIRITQTTDQIHESHEAYIAPPTDATE